MYVQDLNDRIKARAQNEAKREITEELKKFPYFDDCRIKVISYQTDNKEISFDVSCYNIRQQLEEAMVKRRTEEKINDYSKRIIDALDELDAIKDTLTNMET
jgi:hypothetical protein